VYENVSLEGWELWKEHQTILINHYGLHPADPETRKLLRAEMEEFFFGEDARMPDGWVSPSAGGGAPARKKK
jgi:Fe-S cluster biosynthesis and repair protein YggX